MTRSPYTLNAAREILLGKRSKTIKVLDGLLGAGILAAGPTAVVTGQPWLAAVWGWVDQKNELIARLHELVEAGRDKLRKAAGQQRHEVLAATHTALVTGAFFAALREVTGRVLDDVGLTAADKRRLVKLGESGEAFTTRNLISQLLEVEIPLPWSGSGFQANLDDGIRPYYIKLTEYSVRFFSGFAVWEKAFRFEYSIQDGIPRSALDRYRAEYLSLAAEVPEFMLWTLFGEHHAEQNALARLEEFTAALAAKASGAPDLVTIASLNRAILTTRLVDLDETAGVTAVRSPSVARGYVEPGYRTAIMRRDSQPSSEEWWQEQPKGADLAAFLAAHFVSPQAAERPLVVLGHPGSGKSLLTKICAARLSPAHAFTAVRVPLRDVPDPSASVYRQIEDVLHETTNGRVEWARLCDASRNRVRVVLIDGLDELMQATGATESRYLRNVMDFQRTEAIAGGPVAVLVTSRTLVADLAAIPEGCLMVRLDEFTDEQIDTWAERWAEANEAGVSDGTVRPIDAEILRSYGELARQPLLLLLLAIVSAERDLPPGDNSASLYRMLLDDFIRRELGRPDYQAAGLTDEERRLTELWKLAVVAFGMLNRGRQHLHEDDLAADLRALPGPVAVPNTTARDVGRLLGSARRLVGRFFFVNTSEADAGEGGRSYEFLHATFAEFLMAHHAVTLSREAASALARRTSFQPWDDDLLFALLSHTLIVGSGARTVGFVRELARGDQAIAEVLEHIISVAHQRWGRGRYGDYDPAGLTATQRLAAYTANLVMMRLAVATGPVPVARLCPPGQTWKGQVRFWDSMLSGSSQWAHLIKLIAIHDGQWASIKSTPGSGVTEELVAILEDDRDKAARLALGRVLLRAPARGVAREPGLLADVERLAHLLLPRLATAADLAWLHRLEDLPPELHKIAWLTAAAHAPDLRPDLARRLSSALMDLDSDVAREAQMRVAVQRPDFSSYQPSAAGSPELELLMCLGAVADRTSPLRDRPEVKRLVETPEGRALRAIPENLARRLVPEMAASLLARSQRSRKRRR